MRITNNDSGPRPAVSPPPHQQRPTAAARLPAPVALAAPRPNCQRQKHPLLDGAPDNARFYRRVLARQ